MSNSSLEDYETLRIHRHCKRHKYLSSTNNQYVIGAQDIRELIFD
jgi:hypothetical protein